MKREEHGITIGSDNKVYAIGGFDGKGSLITAERYDPKTNKWERIADLNYSRRSLCVVTLPDGIYAIGGYDGKKYLNSVERYDADRNCWVIMPSLNEPRCAMAAVVTSDCKNIFVMGGYKGNPLDVVERYDSIKQCWEVVSSMINKRFMHGAVIITTRNLKL